MGIVRCINVGIILGIIIGISGCPGMKDINLEEILDRSCRKEQCKVEWFGCVTFTDYEELVATLEFELSQTECEAADLLCIHLLYDETGEGLVDLETVKFKSLEDIPRTSINDSLGYCIIQYLNSGM